MRISDWSSDVGSSDPPQWLSPTPQPLRTTRSPTFHCGLSLASTTPAKSMPGTIGNLRTTGDLPVTARPSLKLMVENSTFTEIGRAHVCTPVTNAHIVCRLLLEKKKHNSTYKHVKT